MSVVLHSDPLSKEFGIEVSRNLNWEHWEPGGEYTKQISLKNISLKTKKLKYKISGTNFFTTRYPQPIVLSSGTSFTLPITFRPLRKDIYEESIQFTTKDGEFRVAMKATLPEAQLKLPEKIEFGMCAVQDQVSLNFEVYNTSQLQTNFQLHCELPFVLIPSSGTLAPKTKCKITVNFKPQGAFVYEENAVCVFGKDKEEELEKVVKLQGIGKFSHIGIENGAQKNNDGSSQRSSGVHFEMNYGNVGVKEMLEKTVTIINYTSVNAPFEVFQKQLNGTRRVDRSFFCSHYNGTVPASGKFKLKISFKPENVNAVYVENFEIVSIGGTSKSTIKCVGTGIGAELSIDSKSVNFGVTKLGEEVVRSFKLKNNSTLPAVYQFQTDCVNNIFKVNSPSGKINGRSTTTVIVRFVPRKPLVYYKKLICLVHNQQPLAVEMFGTCCTNEIKPAVLSRQHLANYNVHVERGISRFSPEYILELLDQRKLKCEDDGTLQIADEDLKQTVEKPELQLTPFEEFFSDGSLNDLSLSIPHVCLDINDIDFGKCKDNIIVQRTLNVSNRTHGKVVCHWMPCENSNFSVMPGESDIAPQSTISFTVVFRPTAQAKFYSCELEAFVFYKSMRDHRLVEEKYIPPPWCLTATVTGHTFPKHHETFLPVCTWDSVSMVFPPGVSTDQPVYRTCLLTNNSPNPVHYSFDKDLDQVFTCKPSISLLRGEYQIVVFRMSPLEPGLFQKKIACLLNDTEKYKVTFDLIMTTETPQVILNPSDFVYFKPTCLGNVSQQKVSIHNVSRVPLQFRWKISEVDHNVLTVSPKEGVILSNEILQLNWSFMPSANLKHLFKAKLFVSVDGGTADSEVQRYVLRFIGEGQSGTITCQENDINLGDTIVGEHVKRTVRIHNDSNCTLKYKFNVHQNASTCGSGDNLNELKTNSHKGEGVILKLDHYEGLIPSSSNQLVDLIVTPKEQKSYNCTISYILLGLGDDENEDIAGGGGKPLCNVHVNGVYPFFFVNDVRGSGSIEHYSKKYLWSLFNLSNFNNLLRKVPCSEELRYDISSRHSTRRRMPKSTEAVNEFNFGSSTIGNLPCVVSINLENKGASTTVWSIRFPTDMQLQMESWADPEELEEDELHEMYVMNSSLFTIKPRKGTISPGKSETIVFEYKHHQPGVHRLPILFKLKQGREIQINLVGTTLEFDCNSLHFTSFDHIFSPVSIGTLQPPLQTYTLHNGSGQVVNYKFDTPVLDAVTQHNYNWKIFECLNPEGELEPLQSLDTHWVFSPIEAKEYYVSVPVVVSNGDSHVISFKGFGYHPNQPILSEEDEDMMTTVLAKQLIQIPEQLVKLSAECLSFSNLPLYTEASHLVFIINLSSEKVVSFSWNIKGTVAENLLNIQPAQGFLNPLEKKMCKVSVSSNGPAAIHDIDVKCTIIDETLMTKYNSEHKLWQKKQEEQKHLFIIKDVPSVKTSGRNSRSPSNKLRSLPDGGGKRSDIDLRKYGALPPIPSDTKSTPRIVEEEVPCDMLKPVPPLSQMIHLKVNVTFHLLEEFCRFPHKDSEDHFIQRYTFSDNDNPDKAPASKEEFSAIEIALSMLVKDVIKDEEFLNELNCLKSEPIPYFAMIPSNNEERNDKMEEIEESSNPNSNILALSSGPLLPSTKAVTDNVETFSDPFLTTTTNELINEKDINCSTFNKEETNEDFTFSFAMREKQSLKRDDEFRNVINNVLENTLYDLLNEAENGEISLTNRPRIIVLPPSAGSQRTPQPSTG